MARRSGTKLEGNNPGGWMVKSSMNSTANAPVKILTNESNTGKPKYTIEQVAKHENANDAWIVIKKKVYDCTKLLKEHPGGVDSILINAGTDCTDEFNSIHSPKAYAMLDDYYIGDAAIPVSKTSPITEPHVDTLIALNPKTWLRCPLIQKRIISHDTRIFRFSLKTQDQKLVIRAYTPITTSYDPPGYFDLLVKVYFRNVHPNFPDGGLMTQHLESLNINDFIEVKGPIGSFGPVYQIIKSVLHDKNDSTELSLIYANRTEKDILLRKELNELARSEEKRFRVYYTVSEIVGNQWTYGIGHVTEMMIRKQLPAPGEDSKTIVLMCGPPSILELACIPNLKRIGFKESEYFAF
ncbi:15966_t:CDS:2 [Acaulospora morrowiae]|uniref:15966_t:CDS:1 n=1 Tax=Acaulospora morrowiae TaxID=94023 RepID=A0A9N9BMW6_9GLOM|nr:15966_t:CDS:2 [Acaulospora morrowiae]